MADAGIVVLCTSFATCRCKFFLRSIRQVSRWHASPYRLRSMNKSFDWDAPYDALQRMNYSHEAWEERIFSMLARDAVLKGVASPDDVEMSSFRCRGIAREDNDFMHL